MKTISTLFIALFLSVQLLAQDEDRMDKIESAKVGMITNRLNLTQEQAQTFWPIYNDYDAKKKEIRANFQKLTSESRSLAATDEKITSDLKEILNIRQKEVDLEKEYYTKFLKVISPRQLAELYRTEQIFLKRLLQLINKNQVNPNNPNFRKN